MSLRDIRVSFETEDDNEHPTNARGQSRRTNWYRRAGWSRQDGEASCLTDSTRYSTTFLSSTIPFRIPPPTSPRRPSRRQVRADLANPSIFDITDLTNGVFAGQSSCASKWTRLRSCRAQEAAPALANAT